MKYLVIGIGVGPGGSYKWMAQAWANAIASHGHSVTFINEQRFLTRTLYRRVLQRINYPASLREYNQELRLEFDRIRPDVTLFYHAYNILPETLEHMKGRSIISGYNNDNFFSEVNLPYKNLYKSNFGLFDVFHLLRPGEISLLKNSYPSLQLFQADCYYSPEDHFPAKVAKRPTVTFIGRAENDLRIDCLSHLVENEIPVLIHGPSRGWHKLLQKKIIKKIPEIRPIYGDEYVKVIRESLMLLNFNGKGNYDDHTIRTYEIPACGSLLLTEDTPKIRDLFDVRKEIDVFSDRTSLLEKARFYLDRPEVALEMGLAAAHRSVVARYDIYSRSKKYLDEIDSIISN